MHFLSEDLVSCSSGIGSGRVSIGPDQSQKIQQQQSFSFQTYNLPSYSYYLRSARNLNTFCTAAVFCPPNPVCSFVLSINLVFYTVQCLGRSCHLSFTYTGITVKFSEKKYGAFFSARVLVCSPDTIFKMAEVKIGCNVSPLASKHSYNIFL